MAGCFGDIAVPSGPYANASSPQPPNCGNRETIPDLLHAELPPKTNRGMQVSRGGRGQRFDARLRGAAAIPPEPVAETMPNIFSYVVLFGWPLVVFLLFRRLPPAPALGWSILAGYLFLPTQTALDLAGLPAINKDGVPVLVAGLLLLFGMGRSTEGRLQPQSDSTSRSKIRIPGMPGHWLIQTLILLLLLSPVLTVLNNSDPVVFGPLFIPGLRLYDAVSIIGALGITVLPYLLARRYLASPESHETLLRILVSCMIVYSLPIMYEIRMSPQLNAMFYGFFPHEFLQHVRADGFRPVVFLYHGLWLAIILAMAIVASLAMWRQKLSKNARAGQWLFLAIFLLVVLYLCRSLGALVIVLMLLPAVLLLGVRGQLMIATIIAGIVLSYPMLRARHLVPVDRIVELAGQIDEERAGSFAFRVANEDALLARASLRPLAGWGTWGRQEVFDPETGTSTSVTDGAWIITIGAFGWLGYISSFGLLTLPILLLFLGRKRLGLEPATSGLALVLATNLLDLLPNATLTPVTWLIGGALIGRCAYRAPVTDGSDPLQSGATRSGSGRSWEVVTDTPSARKGRAGIDRQVEVVRRH